MKENLYLGNLWSSNAGVSIFLSPFNFLSVKTGINKTDTCHQIGNMINHFEIDVNWKASELFWSYIVIC